MDQKKCPHLYGTPEYDRWWDLKIKETIEEVRKRDERARQQFDLEVSACHGHDFDPRDKRCFNCGLWSFLYQDRVDRRRAGYSVSEPFVCESKK